MKIRVFVLALALSVVGPREATCDEGRIFETSVRLTLGTDANRSASVRIADIDRDNDLDVIVANGRHWPQQNFLLINQGRARFSVQRNLGEERRTSYATEVADLDGDGDLDIAVGNDMAPNQVFLNDGSGHFDPGDEFGEISSVRSLTLADVDSDGDVDILATSRGRPNQIYLNESTGRFGLGQPFGTREDSTIDVAVADLNSDGHPDLVLANRDGQQNYVLLNDGLMNFAKRIPFGTGKDQTRAVAIADLDEDGNPDLVAGNIGQPNVVYFGNGNEGVRAVENFGRNDGQTYALAVADMDDDGDLDVVAGNVGQQNAVFFNQRDEKRFREVRFGDLSHATYGLDTGDLDGDGFADIAVANSGSENTLIVFLSDNGGEISQAANNAPLQDDKGSTLEGGIRVPMFMHWPNKIPAGSVFDHPVLALDFYPTFARLAGASIPSNKILDGKDIWVDFLAGKNSHANETMYWLRHHGSGNEVSVRRGNLKAYRKNFGVWKVYDVATDIGESQNVSLSDAEQLTSLIADGLEWSKTHKEPQWHDTQNGLNSWIKTKMPKYEETFRSK